MRVIFALVMVALFVFIIVVMTVSNRALARRAARLDEVCEHVREQLCLRLNYMDKREGSAHVELPASVEINACVPDAWSEMRLGTAVQRGGEAAYDAELRAQATRVVREIPPLIDFGPCEGR